MKSARDNVKAQLARERQDHAGITQALRADLERERYDVAMTKRRLRAGAAAVTGLLADLDSLDSLHDIRERIDAIGVPLRRLGNEASDHHSHIHVAMGSTLRETVGIEPTDAVRDAAGRLADALEARIEPTALYVDVFRGGGILPTDLLAERRGSHDPTTAAGKSMVEPARTEEELEDELLDARAAQAMAEYQERTGLTAEQVAAKTARGLLDAIDSPLADSTPEEVAALAALADTLAPLRQYEPLSDPAGIVTQDRATGQVVDDTSAACEARIAPTGETTAQPATGFAYTPGSEAANAALAEGTTTDAQAAQAGQEAALEAGERRCHNPEPHWGHDWWDDHEPDATKWFCEGIPAPEFDAQPRPGESWEDMSERHAAYAESAGVPTPTIGTEAMEDAIQAAVQAGTWTEGGFTVRDTDGSTATYAWDGTEPISTTPAPPPPIELEEERYDALLTYLREELDAEEPEADASDILEALGLYVPEEWAQPTELERLATIAPPTGAVDRLVADVLAHAKGGINSPGDWFLTAATVLFTGMGTLGSSQRDHIWSLATELARQRITADHTATAIILEREQEALAVTTERVGRFTETLTGYAAMLDQLGAPPA